MPVSAASLVVRPPLVPSFAPIVACPPPVRTVAADAVRAALVLHGELDLAVAGQLAAVIDTHLRAGRRFLRADCTGVEFVDSAVLSVLVDAHRKALSRRGTFILTGVRSRLRRLLEIVALDHVLLTAPATADERRTLA